MKTWFNIIFERNLYFSVWNQIRLQTEKCCRRTMVISRYLWYTASSWLIISIIAWPMRVCYDFHRGLFLQSYVLFSKCSHIFPLLLVSMAEDKFETSQDAQFGVPTLFQYQISLFFTDAYKYIQNIELQFCFQFSWFQNKVFLWRTFFVALRKLQRFFIVSMGKVEALVGRSIIYPKDDHLRNC